MEDSTDQRSMVSDRYDVGIDFPKVVSIKASQIIRKQYKATSGCMLRLYDVKSKLREFQVVSR